MRGAKNVGVEIRLKRVKAGMNQAELAAILGTSQIVVRYWERGLHRPVDRFVRKLNQVLNLDPLAMKISKYLGNRGKASQ